MPKKVCGKCERRTENGLENCSKVRESRTRTSRTGKQTFREHNRPTHSIPDQVNWMLSFWFQLCLNVVALCYHTNEPQHITINTMNDYQLGIHMKFIILNGLFCANSWYVYQEINLKKNECRCHCRLLARPIQLTLIMIFLTFHYTLYQHKYKYIYQ